MHAHDLVELRLVAGDRVEVLAGQLLDQLGFGGLVLDQYDTGPEPLILLGHRALQLGILQAPAKFYPLIVRRTCSSISAGKRGESRLTGLSRIH